jgi:hypothetical protein
MERIPELVPTKEILKYLNERIETITTFATNSHIFSEEDKGVYNGLIGAKRELQGMIAKLQEIIDLRNSELDGE